MDNIIITTVQNYTSKYKLLPPVLLRVHRTMPTAANKSDTSISWCHSDNDFIIQTFDSNACLDVARMTCSTDTGFHVTNSTSKYRTLWG